MNFVGKLDINLYKGIAENIITDEVIITDERIDHIIQRRGKDFYEEYKSVFAEVVKNPDYIFRDKMENTALAAKRIIQGGSSINLVVRLATESDDPNFKNSIITAMIEGRKRFEQRLRNNKPIYEKLDKIK